MLAELHRVDVGTQNSRRCYHRHAALLKLLNQVLDIVGALADHSLVQSLIQTHCHCLDLTNRDTTIGEETLEQGDHSLHLCVERTLVGADTTTA